MLRGGGGGILSFFYNDLLKTVLRSKNIGTRSRNLKNSGFDRNLDTGTVRKRNITVLRIRIRDPMPFWPLDPGSGRGKKIKIRIRDEHPGSYFRELKTIFWGLEILKLFYADLESFWPWIWDPGWKKFGSSTPEYKLEKGNKSKKRARCYGAQQQIRTDVREVGIGDRGDRKQMERHTTMPNREGGIETPTPPYPPTILHHHAYITCRITYSEHRMVRYRCESIENIHRSGN